MVQPESAVNEYRQRGHRHAGQVSIHLDGTDKLTGPN
jgi:hypothetical protein